MSSLKENYSLRVTLIAQYLLNVSKEYNKPIRDLAEECIFRAARIKYRKDDAQQVLPIEQILLPLDKRG